MLGMSLSLVIASMSSLTPFCFVILPLNTITKSFSDSPNWLRVIVEGMLGEKACKSIPFMMEKHLSSFGLIVLTQLEM